ncbi:DNA repair and recombination protein RadB [Candidatus Woesearchaeota archaeon]|nr:DNA repair and recombination protein RadB [Candidatus Woesearchaeota archaeon]
MGIDFISSGNEILDNLLEGGLNKGKITLLYGPAGSGKTTFAKLIFLEQARRGNKVIFIDTEKGFSLQRIEQLCAKYKSYLDYLFLFRPTNFQEQINIVKQISKIVSQKVGAIIVDTISVHFRVERSEDKSRADQYLSIQVQLLSEIAKKYSIPIVITTQVYEDINTSKIRPIGKELLTSNSDCVIEIEKLHSSRRKLTLQKHPSLQKKQVYFSLTNNGAELC